MYERCPGGYWFLGDPGDLRELEGLLETGHGTIVDEIALFDFPVTQIKKLFDVVKTRRIKCRHFNGTKPQGCPMILSTNSNMQNFFPRFTNEHDKTGVFRRMFFQEVCSDIRSVPRPIDTKASKIDLDEKLPWVRFVRQVCQQASRLNRVADVLDAALNIGVALVPEVNENAQEICEHSGLKPLEKKRFLNKVVQVFPAWGAEEEEFADVFGHGGSID